MCIFFSISCQQHVTHWAFKLSFLESTCQHRLALVIAQWFSYGHHKRLRSLGSTNKNNTLH